MAEYLAVLVTSQHIAALSPVRVGTALCTVRSSRTACRAGTRRFCGRRVARAPTVARARLGRLVARVLAPTGDLAACDRSNCGHHGGRPPILERCHAARGPSRVSWPQGSGRPSPDGVERRCPPRNGICRTPCGRLGGDSVGRRDASASRACCRLCCYAVVRDCEDGSRATEQEAEFSVVVKANVAGTALVVADPSLQLARHSTRDFHPTGAVESLAEAAGILTQTKTLAHRQSLLPRRRRQQEAL